jgi:hypothetical protein
MKKAVKLALAIVALGAFTMTACKKYEEGPSLSLRSKKARMAGDWKVEAYYEDGVDKTSDYRTFIASESFTMDKDGSYTSSSTTTSAFGGITSTDNGTWEFINDKEDLRTLSSQANATADTMVIVKLKNKEMWAKSKSGSPVVEIHYTAQ